jgi:hypothetical protein
VSDPSALYEHAGPALAVRQARGLRMSSIQIGWEKPYSSTWRHGLSLARVKNAIPDRVEVDATPGSKFRRIISEDIENVVWDK